jgi:[ribosomal protein S5]-alanine N-acetyltransferase
MLTIDFNPFPNLETEHLILRQLRSEDEEAIFSLRSDDRVREFLDRPRAESLDVARQFIRRINDAIVRNEAILWAIALKRNDELVGTICLWNVSKEQAKAEIGYELRSRYQGKGIMQEALAPVVEYGFQRMGLASIEGVVHPENGRSIRLLERNHFVRGADLRADAGEGRCRDLAVYVLHAPVSLAGDRPE